MLILKKTIEVLQKAGSIFKRPDSWNYLKKKIKYKE